MGTGPDRESGICRECRRRRSTRWTWGSLTALFVGVAAALATGRGPRPAEAQALQGARNAAVGFTYRQRTAAYTQMADVINQYARQGWEPFQVVPITRPSPSTGGGRGSRPASRRPAEGARR